MAAKGKKMMRFNTLSGAKAFQDRAIKAMMILLGDDQLFWVVSLAEGARLQESGYEEANDD